VRHRWMIFVPVFAVAWTAALAPARADCVSQCSMITPQVWPNDWESRKMSCLQSCGNQPARISYGALAYGVQSTAWGYSYGKGSVAEAAREALSGCKPNGDDCKVVYDFHNTCAALAAVESKGVFASAYAPSKAGAEAAAMADCKRQYGNDCAVEVSACSLP
jgi:Domain of unknown function (DUF4189)